MSGPTMSNICTPSSRRRDAGLLRINFVTFLAAVAATVGSIALGLGYAQAQAGRSTGQSTSDGGGTPWIRPKTPDEGFGQADTVRRPGGTAPTVKASLRASHTSSGAS